MKDQRQHSRLTLPLDAEYITAGESRVLSGRIQNLSAGGAALLVVQPLPSGTRLASIRFLLPAEEGRPAHLIDTPASVVRQVGGQAVPRASAVADSARSETPPAGEVSGWLLGLEFTDIRSEDRERIKQFVDLRLVRRELPPTPPLGKRRIPFQQVISLRFEDFKAFVQEVSANISETGMFLTTRSPQPPGSTFEFQFTLGEDFPLIEGEAEVVWVRERTQGPDKPAGMGVRFLRLDSDSQPVIRRLITRYQAAGHKPFDLEAERRPGNVERQIEPSDRPRVAEKPAATLDTPRAETPATAGTRGTPDARQEDTEETERISVARERSAEPRADRDAQQADTAILLALREELEGLLAKSSERLEAAREEAGRHITELGLRLEEAAGREEKLRSQVERLQASRERLENRLREAELRARGRPLVGPLAPPRRGRLLLRRLALLATGALLGVVTTMLLVDRGETPDPVTAAAMEATESLSPQQLQGREPTPAPREPASDPTPGELPGPGGGGGSEVASTSGAAAPEAVVRAWADAWSEQRADDFLSLYSREFTPPGGADRSVWESIRRERIEAPSWIRVTVDGLVVEERTPDRALVRFEQIYLTPTYGDHVTKRLELVWEGGAWKVAREELLKSG